MDIATLIGLIIAFVVVIGGFGIGVWLILIHNLNSKDERKARIEARNRERLALIEKGMDPNLADQGSGHKPSGRIFLIGLVIVFACIGRLIVFSSGINPGTDNGTMIYVLPASFAGLAFLVYHFYQKGFFSRKN